MSDKTTSLNIIFDKTLSWTPFIDMLYKKVASRINAITWINAATDNVTT